MVNWEFMKKTIDFWMFNSYLSLKFQSGLEKSVELLLNNGADINALTKSGKTALHRAAASGIFIKKFYIFESLVQLRCYFMIRCYFLWTADFKFHICKITIQVAL